MKKVLFFIMTFWCVRLLGVIWIDTRYTDFQQGSYDPEIYISRRLQTETNFNDSGCIEYHTRFDVNNDGWYDLVSADGSGPNLRVWLGSANGYSAANLLTYSITYGGNCDISDLNLDNYPELIHSGGTMNNFYIYWGTPTGPSPTDITLLPNDVAEAVYVADFDKDTYLDIVIAGYNVGILYIYWGSSFGYSVTNRASISVGPMVHNIEAADLDKNGFLDIVVPQTFSPYDVIIFYQQSPRNFTQQRLNFADTGYLHGLSIADLNNDGFIDIVATGYINIAYSSIYWGSSSGYSDLNKLNLNPGRCYGGSTIADFNNDNFLDILYYKESGTALLKPIIYYNLRTEPWFSDANTRKIGISLRASGGTAADFNYDGYIDVFINNYIANSNSYVFYGPDFNVYDRLPVNRDHHGTFREPRQIQAYYSKICCPCSVGNDTIIIGGDISWIANTPGNSIVDIFVRSGNTPNPDPSWTDWHQILTNPGPLPISVLNKKYIQYKATLQWKNPAQLPNLEQVKLDFSCGTIGIEETTKEESQFNIKVVGKNIFFYSKDDEIEIYDVVGKLIKSISLQKEASTKINSSGVYFIKSKAYKITKKIIIL